MQTMDCSTSPAIISVHSDIINTHILPKLDGPTLASTSCASSEIHSLCSEENLWKNICDSAWPSTTDPRVQDIISSFPSGHRSFFADSFPTLDYNQLGRRPKSKIMKMCAGNNGGLKPELISAVDVHVGDRLVYSNVLVKKDMPGWYTNSFLRLDLLEAYEKVTLPVKVNGEENECIKFLEKEMKLSWIMIDPTRKRAVNLSSQASVNVRWHWMSKDYIEVHYGIVMATAGVEAGLARFEVTVICERKKGGELEMIQISMQVEDMEGKMMSGKDSLVILHEAMDRRRAKRGIDEEKKRYENFLEMRRIYRENKQERESIPEMIWIAIGFTTLMAFWTLMILFCFFFSWARDRIGYWVRQLNLQVLKCWWSDRLSSLAWSIEVV